MSEQITALKDILAIIEDAHIYGATHVVEIDSGRAGPNVGIIACTHGNEPAGLAAIQYLLSDLILLRGKLFFIIGNPKAAASYFDAASDDTKEQARYIDKNLNRMPNNKAELANSKIYEYQRAEELMPVLEQLDGVLDLHSTSSNAPPMLICVDENSAKLMMNSLFPFKRVITGVEQHIEGKFLIEYCERAVVKFIAECGQHEELEASQRAIDISIAFLHRMNIVQDMQPEKLDEAVEFYAAKQAVFLPKDCGDFKLRRTVEPFEFVKKGQELACNGADVVVAAPTDGYAIMCPEAQSALDCSEALLFLCDKG